MATKILTSDGLTVTFDKDTLVDDLVARGQKVKFAQTVADTAEQFLASQPQDQPVRSERLFEEVGKLVLAASAPGAGGAGAAKGQAAGATPAQDGGKQPADTSSGPITGGVTLGAKGKPQVNVNVDIGKILTDLIGELGKSTTDKDKARASLLQLATAMFDITDAILDKAKQKKLSDEEIAKLKKLIDKFKKDIQRASDALDKGDTDAAKDAANDAKNDAEQIKGILGL